MKSIREHRCALQSTLRVVWACAAVMTMAALLAAQPINRDAHSALQVYVIDVEGGQATLFVTPERQSLLIDTGWPGYNGRDADRILAAAKQAGISKIDYVLITHYHRDHVGGVTQLAARIPIGTVIDHGENRERTGDTEQGWQEYQQLIAANHLKRVIAKPGDPLPIRGSDTRVVSADGALIAAPAVGAGSGAGETNSACNAAGQRPADNTENARSLGVVIAVGKLRIVDLGDLTWDKEVQLMCPVNRLGKVDVYIVSHHGSEQSGSPALVNGIAPRVALMDNGADKGGSVSAWEIVEKSPRLEDLWQLHFANAGGSSHNASEAFIANLAGPDGGNYLKLTGWPDGSFEVWNSRTRQTKHYEAK